MWNAFIAVWRSVVLAEKIKKLRVCKGGSIQKHGLLLSAKPLIIESGGYYCIFIEVKFMKDILMRKEGNIAIITLNRPEVLNAFRSQTLTELTEAITEAGKDPDTYVIILNSSSGRSFTAGGDIKEESQLTGETAYEFSERGQACAMAVYHSPIPVIAAVDGYALGGGMELILAADITVAAKSAKIGIPTINLAGIPCWTATQLLPRIAGPSRACDILLTGRMLSAEECYRFNLVEYLTEKEELMDKAMEIAETIADKSPHAVALMRQAIKQGLELPVTEALTLERNLFTKCYDSGDRQEATAAFLEKRPHGKYSNRDGAKGR